MAATIADVRELIDGMRGADAARFKDRMCSMFPVEQAKAAPVKAPEPVKEEPDEDPVD